MKVHRLKSYRRNLLKNNLVISVGRVLIQTSIKKSLATLNIKMLKRLSYSMNELLNVCLLSNLRRFDEAIMSQFEGLFCFEIYHWKIQNFQTLRTDAITGAMVAQSSPPIGNRLNGYNFCIMM